MEPFEIGLPTLVSRVESWECDFNDHWNARFYARSFQLAAERVASLGGRANPGVALLASRVIRYHRELFVGAPVAVRSARVADGAYAGAVAHLLSSGERLSATAIDLPGTGGDCLPTVAAETIRVAFPRTPAAPPHDGETEAAETGPVRPAELDHTGALLCEDIMRRAALGLHGLVDRLGFTPEFTRETGISRMAVESRLTPLGRCAPGDFIRVHSRIASVGTKSLTTRHRLETDGGEVIAEVEHSIVAVDLKARRAVELPALARERLMLR